MKYRKKSILWKPIRCVDIETIFRYVEAALLCFSESDTDRAVYWAQSVLSSYCEVSKSFTSRSCGMWSGHWLLIRHASHFIPIGVTDHTHIIQVTDIVGPYALALRLDCDLCNTSRAIKSQRIGRKIVQLTSRSGRGRSYDQNQSRSRSSSMSDVFLQQLALFPIISVLCNGCTIAFSI